MANARTTLDQDTLDALLTLIRDRFAAGDRLDAVVRAAKAAHPGVFVTGTQTSSMAEEPFHQEAAFSLFLVDGSNHCVTITASLATASGVIIAEDDEEDA